MFPGNRECHCSAGSVFVTTKLDFLCFMRSFNKKCEYILSEMWKDICKLWFENCQDYLYVCVCPTHGIVRIQRV